MACSDPACASSTQLQVGRGRSSLGMGLGWRRDKGDSQMGCDVVATSGSEGCGSGIAPPHDMSRRLHLKAPPPSRQWAFLPPLPS